VQPFTQLTAIALPLVRANIDTDAIIPSREMKQVSKTGLADGLFADWRYRSPGGREPNPDFGLNDPAYAGARILLGGENFGCGSSREHAVWALAEYGFRAVVAPSFAPIFRNNCVRNGVVPVVLPLADVERIAEAVRIGRHGRIVTIDLEAQCVRAGDAVIAFAIDDEAKQMLVHGLDAIDVTQRLAPVIEAFRQADRLERPWVYFEG
jgi:3-isopropylmalate/(R)-2-methylmalate dehydratase small subunit